MRGPKSRYRRPNQSQNFNRFVAFCHEYRPVSQDWDFALQNELMSQSSSSIYFENFPSEWDTKVLWNVFMKFSIVDEIFILNKHKRQAKRFGFIRIPRRENPRVVLHVVDGCGIGVHDRIPFNPSTSEQRNVDGGFDIHPGGPCSSGNMVVGKTGNLVVVAVCPLGGNVVLFTFNSKDIMDGFINIEGSWLSQLVIDLKPWEAIHTPSKSSGSSDTISSDEDGDNPDDLERGGENDGGEVNGLNIDGNRSPYANNTANMHEDEDNGKMKDGCTDMGKTNVLKSSSDNLKC
ncbi:hypothetical protein GH714_005315 [Hevea brasiliensis]|uniref:RRM domain-containing protein n=1 Tax=Hevea brasiliensis TaxID=3981 RepID=A0A6A6L0J3_HEVBR|nr:hypothetical protein GH714_005315 [Hevea brasiliensis]